MREFFRKWWALVTFKGVSLEDVTARNGGGLNSNRPVHAVARPGCVTVKLGDLEIRTKRIGSGGVVCGRQLEVLVDGKPFPVKSIVIRAAADSVVEAEIVYFPKAKDEPCRSNGTRTASSST